MEKEKIKKKIVEIICAVKHLEPKEVTPAKLLVSDLGMDNLEAIRMEMFIEEEFPNSSFPFEEAEDEIYTVEDLVEYVFLTLTDRSQLSWGKYLAVRPESEFPTTRLSLGCIMLVDTMISGSV